MSISARSVFLRKITAILAIVALPGLAIAAGDHAREKKMPAAKPMNQTSKQGEAGGLRGLLMPTMNATRGRKLFATKGCVACHAVNGIGGEGAPPFDAKMMDRYMNPFDFAAKMWTGAPTMALLQEEVLGEQIQFTGDELADIVAFAHSVEEQGKFTMAEIPEHIMKLMEHAHKDDDAASPHEEDETKPGHKD